MTETNVWLINVISNVGLGAGLLVIIKFFLDRFIKQIDEKFKEHEGRIKYVENEADELKNNYVRRFEDVKTHFTDEIEKVVADKNNFRIVHSGVLAEIKTKVEYLSLSVNEVKKTLTDWFFKSQTK